MVEKYHMLFSKRVEKLSILKFWLNFTVFNLIGVEGAVFNLSKLNFNVFCEKETFKLNFQIKKCEFLYS